MLEVFFFFFPHFPPTYLTQLNIHTRLRGWKVLIIPCYQSDTNTGHGIMILLLFGSIDPPLVTSGGFRAFE